MSEEKSIEQRAKELLSEQLGLDIERMENHATLIEDLGCDSLDLIEIAIATEDEFDIELTDEDVEKWRTVGDMVCFLEAKQQ